MDLNTTMNEEEQAYYNEMKQIVDEEKTALEKGLLNIRRRLTISTISYTLSLIYLIVYGATPNSIVSTLSIMYALLSATELLLFIKDTKYFTSSKIGQPKISTCTALIF